MADLLVHHWSHPTTPAGPGWDIVQSNVVRLTTEKGFSARAALGEAEVIRVIVDDLTGTADYKTLHRWYLVETATAGSQLVWNGYINDQWIDNGEDGDLIYPTGVGRRWELEIVQENTILGFRAIQGAADAAHGVRPEETPGVRLAWILGSDFLSTVVDHGLIDWTRLDAMPAMNAVDYRGQTAGDVLRDISLKTGFNHYVRYRDASSDIELAFFDANTSTLDSSTLRVSNVEADVDFATTWPPFFGGYRLQRKGDRVAAGVLVQGAEHQSYDYRLPTSYEFGFRDMVASDANTKTQAEADRLRNRLLTQHSEQDERITGLRIQVPAANLNDVKHGQRIEARFTHLPGWEDFRWARVISKAFSRPEAEPQDRYDVDLELSPQSIPAQEQYGTDTQASAAPFMWPLGVPSVGNLLIGFVFNRGGGTADPNMVPWSTETYGATIPGIAGTDWTQVTSFPVEVPPAAPTEAVVAMAWREATADDTQFIGWGGMGGTSRPRCHQMEIAGLTAAAPSVTATSAAQVAPGTTYTSPDIIVAAAGYIIAGFGWNTGGPAEWPGWPGFTMTVGDPANTLTSGWCNGYGGWSWFGYIYAPAAGTYHIDIERTDPPGWPPAWTNREYGWIMGFWAGPESAAYPA